MESHKLLNMIKEEQAKSRHVSEEAIVRMAESLNLPIAHVYGVATFYSFLSIEPLGRHVIRICKSVPCCLQDGEMIAEVIEKTLGISSGETTLDRRFSFEVTNCIGACDHAPAMLVDDTLYGNLTPEKIAEILRSFD